MNSVGISSHSAAVRDIDFSNPDYLATPWPELMRLQREAPIFWSQKQKAWIITRHADVRAGFSDRRLSNQRRAVQLFSRFAPLELMQFPDVVKYMISVVNNLDGPQQIRLRTLMLKGFRTPLILDMRPFIQQVIDENLDELANEPGDFDFCDKVSARVPNRIIQRMLDIPREYGPLFFDWATSFTTATAATSPSVERYVVFEQKMKTLNAVLSPLIEQRRHQPGNDLISSFVHAREGQDQLTHDEVLSCCHAMIVAGVETTAHALANGIVELIKRPDLRAIMEQGGDAAMALVTELNRYPCGAARGISRLAVEDFEWHGQKIKAGDILWLMIHAANVDPEVFPDGCTIDPARDCRHAMTFGPGFHFCIGHLLTRLEQQEFFQRALKRFDFTLAMDESELKFAPRTIFRGYESVRVRCQPRA